MSTHDEAAIPWEAVDQSRTRRRLLRSTAAGIIAASLGSLGLLKLFAAQRPISVLAAGEAENRHFALLDQSFARGGDHAIRTTLAAADEQCATSIIDWIIDRRKAGLYADIVSLAGDSRVEMRIHAANRLWIIPSPALKANLADLHAMAASEPIPGLRSAWCDLALAAAGAS